MGAIDIHVHVGPRWDDVRDVRASCDDLAGAMAEAGVDLAVASSAESLLSRTPLGAEDDEAMESRLYAGNEALLEDCRSRSWLAMTVVVDPQLDASLRQAAAMLGDPRVVGVKLHPDRHRYRVCDYAPVVLRLLSGFPGKALQVHCTATAWSDPAPLIAAAARYQGVPVIIAHLGRTDPPELVIDLIRARRAQNVFVDTSAMRDPDMVVRAISTIGAERILFGSDFPFYRPGHIGDLIRASKASESDVDTILQGNARVLLGSF